MSFDLSRTYRGSRAPGALFAILLTLGVNAAIFGLLGWINHRAVSTADTRIQKATQVQLVQPKPAVPVVEPKRIQEPRKQVTVKREKVEIRHRQVAMQRSLRTPKLRPPKLDLDLRTLTVPVASNIALPVQDHDGAVDGETGLGVDGSAGPLDYDAVDEKPVRTRGSRPVYPLNARRLGLTGEVRVRFVVDTEGRVTAARVVESTGRGRFDRNALNAVERWRFKPGKKDKQPVDVLCEVTVAFRLEN